ncbi:phosphate signaling complex protein PhoU [Fretibacter rubidus]|uniref:phosphate signaling complex protein PhoU n=1 Tax=Fretibacter rubidus TaxID=570162 RepID=UPI00352B8888
MNLLNNSLSQMGAIVEDMIGGAIRAVKKRDSELAKATILRDKEVNTLQEEIDADALRLLALRHPIATDLRRVIGTIRATNDLERMGDLAEGIARRALDVNAFEAVDLARGVSRMGKLVKRQVKDALDAMFTENADKAVQVWLHDQDVDALYASLFRELLTYMMEDHRNIKACTSLLFIAKNLERIGDHATNISEIVYFTVHGRSLTNDDLVLDGQEEDED